MSDLRLFGVFVALAIFFYVISQRRFRQRRRIDTFIGLLIASALLAISFFPTLVNGLLDIFQVQSRLLALSILGNIVLFVLFLSLLNRVAEVRMSVSDLVRALAKANYRSEDPAGGSIMVIIPAYNEEANITAVLADLPATLADRPVSVVVISDGGRDRTVEVVRKHAKPVMAHLINRGQGTALRTGFEIALQEGAEVVVTMDADGQHRAQDLAHLVVPILAGEADYVSGSRFLGEYADRGSGRHFGIVVFSGLISLLCQRRVTDCANGFRAIRVSSLALLDLQEGQFSAPELIIEALSKGLRFQEVPVSILARAQGTSKKPRGFGYPWGFALAICRSWLRS